MAVSGLAFAARAQRFRRPSPEEVSRGLRNQALILSPEDVGVSVAPHLPYAIVMDMAYPQAVASLMSVATGDASMYISTGGGVIGGSGHEAVRNAAVNFVREAAKYSATLAPTSDFPYPAEGKVRFYVRTPEGVFVSQEVPEAELANRRHPLSVLYFAGQNVITQLRESTGGFK